MVNILQFKVNAIGCVDLLLNYNHRDVVKQDVQSFTSVNNAINYIHSMQKTVYLQQLENYVYHKKHIIENGVNRNQYHKQESLAICENYVKWANGLTKADPTLAEICHFGMQIRTHLERILPAEANDSYQSSRNKLAEIIAFCKNYKESLKQLQQAQQSVAA